MELYKIGILSREIETIVFYLADLNFCCGDICYYGLRILAYLVPKQKSIYFSMNSFHSNTNTSSFWWFSHFNF